MINKAFLMPDEVNKAHQRIKSVVKKTPLDFNQHASLKYNANIYYKREDLQQVRSYKIRGAFNKMVQLSPTEKQKGVVCASAGNHAQGVAVSCKQLKILGKIFMPATTPKQKVDQVKMFGENWVEIILEGDTFDDSSEAALKETEKFKHVYIPPFDDPKIIQGQATIGKEILDQADFEIDYLFMPVGGGGLSAGVSSYFKHISPHTKIICVEPAGAPSLMMSLKAGKLITLDKIDKFVDGAAVKRMGEITFPIIKENVDKAIVIEEGEICVEILNLYNRNAIVLEPAGALSVAALNHMTEEIKDKNVVCILSGSNNDITRMEEMKEKALLFQGLKHYFIVQFPQRAGALKNFVNNALGDKIDITYFQYSKGVNRESGPVVIGLELNKKSDFEPLLQKMKDLDYEFKYLNDNPLLFSTLIN